MTRAHMPSQPDDTHLTFRDGEVFAGLHLIVDLEDGHGLDDPERVERALLDCATACGATVLHAHVHRFSPQGVTGVAVLAESHISVHRWPEIGYAAFAVFMCGDTDPHAAIPVLARAFGTDRIRVTELRRGTGRVDGIVAA